MESGEIALTRRQKQVLALTARGCGAKEIGRQLGISSRTIEIYKKRNVEKLGARNTTHAVAIAVSNGLIDVQELV